MANEPACPLPQGLPCTRVLSAASLGLLAFRAGTWVMGRRGGSGQRLGDGVPMLPLASAERRLQALALSIPQHPWGTCCGPHPSRLQSIPRSQGWAQN